MMMVSSVLGAEQGFSPIHSDGTFQALSGNGRYVVSTLPSGDSRIRRHDLETGVTEVFDVINPGSLNFVAVDHSGSQILYRPTGENFADGRLYVYDANSGESELVTVTTDGSDPQTYRFPSLSPDGRFVLFWSDSRKLVEADTGGGRHLFLHDRVDKTTELITVGPDGAPGDSSTSPHHTLNNSGLSADGLRVIFASNGEGLTSEGADINWDSIYLRDRLAGSTRWLSKPPAGDESVATARAPAIDRSGRFGQFISSDASFFTNPDFAGTENIFVVDLDSGAGPFPVLFDIDGGPPDGDLYYGFQSPRLAAEGRFIVFASYAGDLVPGDDYTCQFGCPDGNRPSLFVLDRTLGTTTLISLDGLGQNLSPMKFDVSADGRMIAGQFVNYSVPSFEIMVLERSDVDVFGPLVGIGFGPVPIGTFENGTLTAMASDETTGSSNIAGIEYQLDGGAWSPMPPLDDAYDSIVETGIQIVSFATEGMHQACVRATDVLGNLGDLLCMDIEVVAGDSTPPVITQFDVQPNPVDVGETAVLSVQASDVTTGDSQIVIIEYQVDGGPWTSIIPPADGFYDESVEEGEVNLVFDTAGTHEVCVRATDAANNVSAPECLDVSAEGPVGLLVKCLHEPIYPQTGEDVVIRARALDRDGNAVFADRLEIYLNDPETPFVVNEGLLQGTNANFTADDEGFLYGCRAERGDESAFSRFIMVDVGEPQLSDFPAIPVLFHGRLSEKVDIVFLPDDDEYSSYSDPAFIEDVWLLISEGFGTMPSFLEKQHMFNFWIGMDSGNASPKPSDELCFRQPPDSFRSKYAFAEAAGIVHRSDCRDNAGSPGLFTIEMNLDRLQVVIHEAGHRPFGLADEYCCDGGYFTNSILDTPPFANLFRRENGCRNDAEDRGFDPNECRELFAAGANWWLFEPDFDDFNPEPWDWMQQRGCAGYANFPGCSLQLLPEVTGPDPDPNGLYACNELMDSYRVDTSGGAVCAWDLDENMPCLWLCRSPGTAADAVWVPSRGELDRYEIGPSEFDRFYWFLGQCSGGKC
jgi:Tol biopolymer transport system component